MQLLPIKRTAYMKGINKKSITHSVLSDLLFEEKKIRIAVPNCYFHTKKIEGVFNGFFFKFSSMTHAKQYMSSETEN